MSYINAHSYYSLRYGTYPIEDLIQEAKLKGIEAISLTDINNTTGSFEFYSACIKNGIQPVLGIDFRNGNTPLFTGIALNNHGFRELNEYASVHHISKTEYDEVGARFDNAIKVYRYGDKRPDLLGESEFIGVHPRDLPKLITEQKKSLNRLIMHPTVSYQDPERYRLHKMLRAVNNNTLYDKLTREQICDGKAYMRNATELMHLYENFDQVRRNTADMLAQCSFQFDGKSKNKKTYTGSVEADRKLLKRLTMDGFEYRYGKNNKEALHRVDKELAIIYEMGFAAYFLITWDIIRYAKSKDFYHVGRGSGANSIVAYCLKITDVCPMELNLYFERFLNPTRTSPPDFDLDFAWNERDQVLEYIFNRYGDTHTALLGTMSTFKDHSIIREFGKVMGLPKAEIDYMETAPESYLNQDSVKRTVVEYGKMIQDFPNLRSIHAGGVLISEDPICCYTALDMPPKGFQTVQWDMYAAEAFGFEKFDILSQRGIGHLKECVSIIKTNQKISVDIHDVKTFLNDEVIKGQLKKGDTIGCFYIESPAMRGLLKKLNCEDYIHLVAASSIIRPGVASSGMMGEYIYRFHNPDSFEYLHPVMKEQLEETYGVMVYQEDVMKVCHHYAGLTLADSDVLRRAMSGKYRSGAAFQQLVEKFHQSAKDLGRSEHITQEIWRQISSFGGYSFCKAHSASFAVESFQSLFLKTYYPLEFIVAVLNNYGGFYVGVPWVYIQEAIKAGGRIHLPYLNLSENRTTIYGSDIYLGFDRLKSLQAGTVEAILNERSQNGPFESLEDFIDRVKIDREQLIILIRAGAFRFTQKSKQQLIWEVHMLMGNSSAPPETGKLFTVPVKEYNLPKLDGSLLTDAYDEMELLGFPVSMSMFDLLQTKQRGDVFARDLKVHAGKTVRIMGNLVTTKYVWAKNNTEMRFGTFLDPHGDFFDTVNFQNSLKDYPFDGAGIYLIMGRVVLDFGFPSVEVQKMKRLPLIKDSRYEK